jgi:hypothetical protein
VIFHPANGLLCPVRGTRNHNACPLTPLQDRKKENHFPEVIATIYHNRFQLIPLALFFFCDTLHRYGLKAVFYCLCGKKID